MGDATNDHTSKPPEGQLTPEATRMALALSLVFVICIFATAYAAKRYTLGSGNGVSSARWRRQQQQRQRSGGDIEDGRHPIGDRYQAAELAAVYGSTRDRLDEVERLRAERRREIGRQRTGLREKDVERFEIVRFHQESMVMAKDIDDGGLHSHAQDIHVVVNTPLHAASDSTTQEQQCQQRKGEQDVSRLPILSRITTLARTQDGKSRILAAVRGALTAPVSTENDKTGFLECSICTEDFVEGVRLRRLPCGHMFHPSCVDRWLKERARTCPLCRLDVEAYLARIDAANHTDVKEPQQAKLPPETV